MLYIYHFAYYRVCIVSSIRSREKTIFLNYKGKGHTSISWSSVFSLKCHQLKLLWPPPYLQSFRRTGCLLGVFSTQFWVLGVVLKEGGGMDLLSTAGRVKWSSGQKILDQLFPDLLASLCRVVQSQWAALPSEIPIGCAVRTFCLPILWLKTICVSGLINKNFPFMFQKFYSHNYLLLSVYQMNIKYCPSTKS